MISAVPAGSGTHGPGAPGAALSLGILGWQELDLRGLADAKLVFWICSLLQFVPGAGCAPVEAMASLLLISRGRAGAA